MLSFRFRVDGNMEMKSFAVALSYMVATTDLSPMVILSFMVFELSFLFDLASYSLSKFDIKYSI